MRFAVSKCRVGGISTAQSEGSTSDTVTVDGNSEFFQAIRGRKSSEMWAVMGELMDTLQAINPRLYNSVLRKINN